MNILVCMKMVPDTSEAEVILDQTGKDIVTNGLKFDVNEADNYAVEEAMLMKEAYGGTVTVLSMDTQAADVALRMALAKGGDRAIRIEDSRVNVRNPLQVAKVLAAVIRKEKFDMTLTGCMSTDDKNMSVGVALAQELQMNYASMVKYAEADHDRVTVRRELEGGLLEVTEVSLPAVLTVQTGINTPRYAPVRQLRQAMKKELKVMNLDDLEVEERQVNQAGSLVELLGFHYPQVVSNAELLQGSPEETAEQLAVKLIKGGLL